MSDYRPRQRQRQRDMLLVLCSRLTLDMACDVGNIPRSKGLETRKDPELGYRQVK